MTHHDVFTEAQIIEIKKLALDTSDVGREKYQNYVLEILVRYHSPDGQTPPPLPPPTPTDPTLPADGRLQPDKGASKDANGWDAVAMKDDPTKFKVVDSEGINVADLFTSEATAQQFIDYYIWQQDQSPIPGPDPIPVPGPGTQGSYPYAAIGAPMQSTTRGPTTRHYASGKADDETIEKNVKNIKFKNYQFVSYVTMHEIEHSDTLSTKLGGTHMGSGWFDHGISFGDGKGQCCLGKEENHPSTDLCVVKGPQLGEIVGKKVGVAGTYFKDKNHTEFWVDLGQGWKKQVEGTNVGGFNPKSEINEAQLRIDGFKKGSVPTIHSSVVTEIAGIGTPAPTPNPTPTPTPTPTPIPTPTPTPTPTPGPIEGDVKMIYPGTGAQASFYYKSSNPGRAQWKSDLPKCWLNQEATAYLKIAKVANTGEEVSLKLRGGNHGSPASAGSCYIIGINYDGGVNCQYEQPHPNNHSMNSTVVTPSPLGNNVVGKWFGIKGIVYQKGDADKIECWIDKGGLKADGTPANDWIKFWETTSKVFFGKCNGGSGGEKALIRLDDISGDPESNVEIKYASVREIKPA